MLNKSICASTFGIKYERGSTREIALLKARTGGKLTVHIPDGRISGDDKASSMLSSHISVLIRQTRRNRMYKHYSVFNSKEEVLQHPYPEMNKEEWTCVCDLFASEEFQRRNAINRENRAKLKIVHTSRSEEKMEALQLQHEVEGKPYIEVNIFTEVLGMKGVYVRVSSVDLSWRLEETKLEIEEMRARQMEYEELLVKRSEMEQAMQEHQRMMEEQQHKKSIR
ncbi:hypothetical protein CJ030_MR2G016444 [Morella rubra]|uniref:Uncharacterized protein n=1 Tax=Morella rubra TaxID=262757 RepID=A0A6A1WE62_9ROSI|nr:hypothetical protein CJ030_MR2G016444 [Morella rubra]